MTKGKLSNTKVYLAGPIEKADDCSSSSWREYIKEPLKSLGIKIWDPLIKPKWFIDKVGEVSPADQRTDLKQFESPENTMDMIHAYDRNAYIRHCCLRLASSCDFMICLVDGPTVGTFEELNVANQQGKPIIFIHKNGKIDSCWRFVQFDFNRCFHAKNINEAIQYLVNIDNGTIAVNNKHWIFLPEVWPTA